MRNVNASWTTTAIVNTLHNINIEIGTGKLYVIVGSIGAGKVYIFCIIYIYIYIIMCI